MAEMQVFEPKVNMMMFFCESCQEVKALPARRGRPPKFCTACTEGGDIVDSDAVRLSKARALGEKRCDLLEMMLRSRGTHIKQQMNMGY